MTSKSKAYRFSCRRRWLRRLCLAWILGLLLATWPGLHDVLADADPATLSSPHAVAAEVPHDGHDAPVLAGKAHCAAHASCSPSALVPEGTRLTADSGRATLPPGAATRTGTTTAPPSPPPIARS